MWPRSCWKTAGGRSCGATACRLHAARVRDQRARCQPCDSLRQRMDRHAVALPAGHRFPRVELTYGEVGQPLGFWSRLATEFPQVNVPVMDRRWNVWLPPGIFPGLDRQPRGGLG